MNLTAKYPDCEVQLSGINGNAFSILAEVSRAVRHHLRVEVEMVETEIVAEIKAFSDDAMSGDYDHLLQTCMKWVDVS